MPIHEGSYYGTYRCPVCGHRDSAEVSSVELNRVVECSYCYTALEVTPRGNDTGRFAVQVAEAPVRG